MGHPTGISPHHSWANRRRPIPEIFPELMGHPMSAERFYLRSYNPWEYLQDYTGGRFKCVWKWVRKFCSGGIIHTGIHRRVHKDWVRQEQDWTYLLWALEAQCAQEYMEVHIKTRGVQK
jgi:hypothetical protein